jgi:uncharacterized BrkB/YihY/UPF0761 family membrane protein
VNPVERAVRRLDSWQQRHRVPAFTFAVIKKFGDDQAGYAVALLTYYAFVSIFPALLALTGVLGLLLRHNPPLQQRIESSALADFPIIGPQLRSQVGLAELHHSVPELVVGVIVAVWGARGLANVVQYTLNTLWDVPKVNWPGFPFRMLRTLGLFVLMGVGAVVAAIAGAVTSSAHGLGISGLPLHVLAFVIAAALDSLLFLGAFRLAVAKVATRQLALGAVVSGIAWQILLTFAGVIVRHDLRHAQAVAGTFGVVLGLIGWMGLQATVTVYAIELDVVRAHHLWPRSITQPPLTAGDKRFLIQSVRGEMRRPEQEVDVTFSKVADHDPLRDGER